ncbi:L-aspartate oxidase [Spirillospora sp. NBC_00431]
MIPSVLAAPDPGWTTETDVVVIGSGIAGLVAALRCRPRGRVLLVTKALLDAGSTRWAQGGIAAALAPDDTPEEHFADTLTAGVGLCDEDAVRALVTEGPDAVRGLIELGAAFDRSGGGEIALTREGGHHRRRIAHAGGDATGAEISRALLAALKDSGVEVIEHALVLDLLKDGAGRAAGVTLHVMGEGQPGGVGAVRAQAVVLATGGLGQVFSATTNPEVSTGDGVALALRAGADVADLEFVQFHPTVLWLGEGAVGQQPLISEAVRGEGALLVDHSGERFMVGRHDLAELAPRDIVAKGIMNRMRETGTSHMLLDGRHFGAPMWENRFPTILAACRHHGIDPVTELIPIVPAAHYASGGVLTDLHGRTSVPGLYACGEVACTGVHGANRLASNSLLEGLVFAERIAVALEGDARPWDAASKDATSTAAGARNAELRTAGASAAGSSDVESLGAGPLGAAPMDAGSGDAGSWGARSKDAASMNVGSRDVESWEARSWAATSREMTSIDVELRDVELRDGASIDVGLSEAASRDVGSRDAASWETGLRGAVSRGMASSEVASSNVGSREAASRAVRSKDVGTWDVASCGAVSKDASSRDVGSRDMARGDQGSEDVGMLGSGSGLVGVGVRGEIQRIMTSYAGVLRGADGLAAADRELAELTLKGADAVPEPGVEAWEVTNLHTVASAIVAAARLREETRGSHWREDFPEQRAEWRGHLVTRLEGNALTTTYEPLEGKRS